MKRCLSGLILLLSVSAGGMAQPVYAEPESTVLIYLDQSPGAVPWAHLWQSIAAREQRSVFYATNSASFSLRLAEGTWARVIVLSRYVSGEPAYAGPLREYAQLHPQDEVQIFTWHDHGETTTPGTAVVGTTAITGWRGNSTTTLYALTSSTPFQTPRPATESGLVLPTFSGIQVRSLATVGPYSETMDSGNLRAIGIQIEPCEDNCFNTWVSKTLACLTERTTQEQHCNVAHGPTSPNPDQQRWTTCMQEAAEDYSNCIGAAFHQYKRCIDFCKALTVPATTQPAPDPGG